MKIIRGLRGLPRFTAATAVTLGNFDGVHRGHQMLIDGVRQHAASHGLLAAVVVFEPQPLEYFRPDDAPSRIYSLAEKLRALRAHRVDVACVLPFNAALAAQTPTEFVETVLVHGLQARVLLVGDDWRFGKDRAGDVAFLRARQSVYGYVVEQAPTLRAEGERVSSTRVRELLAAGRVDDAAGLLGRLYAVRGQVIEGQQLGRTIGAPTANVRLRRDPPLRHGVYTVWLDGLPAVGNFGTRPTVVGGRPQLEVHVLDRQIDLYNRTVRVQWGGWLRPEMRFDGIEALAAQIQADFAAAREWHRHHPRPSKA